MSNLYRSYGFNIAANLFFSGAKLGTTFFLPDQSDFKPAHVLINTLTLMNSLCFFSSGGILLIAFLGQCSCTDKMQRLLAEANTWVADALGLLPNLITITVSLSSLTKMNQEVAIPMISLIILVFQITRFFVLDREKRAYNNLLESTKGPFHLSFLYLFFSIIVLMREASIETVKMNLSIIAAIIAAAPVAFNLFHVFWKTLNTVPRKLLAFCLSSVFLALFVGVLLPEAFKDNFKNHVYAASIIPVLLLSFVLCCSRCHEPLCSLSPTLWKLPPKTLQNLVHFSRIMSFLIPISMLSAKLFTINGTLSMPDTTWNSIIVNGAFIAITQLTLQFILGRTAQREMFLEDNPGHHFPLLFERELPENNVQGGMQAPLLEV